MAEALTVVGLGLSLYQGIQGRRDQKKASHEAKDANAQQMALQQQQMDQINKQPQEAADASLAGRSRQRALAAAAFGRGDTITTSPIGAEGMASTGQKGLIGT